jgi:hypothetical protein
MKRPENGKKHMKNKKIKIKTGPAPTTAGTGLLRHVWNTDVAEALPAHQLWQAGDSSAFGPLLENGHRPVPGWPDLTCQTRAIGAGLLWRIYNHAPAEPWMKELIGLEPRVVKFSGLAEGRLYVVGGVAADAHSANLVWAHMQEEAAPLYAIGDVARSQVRWYPSQAPIPATYRSPQPWVLPWLSIVALDKEVRTDFAFYIHRPTPLLGLAKEWLRLREITGNPVRKPCQRTLGPTKSAGTDGEMN